MTGRTELPDGELQIRSDVRPGDIGDIVAAHGRIYAAEYGWNATFEAYVAQHLASFVLRAPTPRERIWIAGDHAGFAACIAIVDGATSANDDVTGPAAQLRWFLVHPRARGLGLGHRLIGLAIAFARDAGYERVFLDTVRGLDAAARLYAAAGFILESERPEEGWGREVVAQRLTLGGLAGRGTDIRNEKTS